MVERILRRHQSDHSSSSEDRNRLLLDDDDLYISDAAEGFEQDDYSGKNKLEEKQTID